MSDLACNNGLKTKQEAYMAKDRLKRSSRMELLELLSRQMELNSKLQEENEQLKKELEDRTIRIENSGTLAEAALKLSGIFEAADKAAKIYLEVLAQNSQAKTLNDPSDSGIDSSTDFLTEKNRTDIYQDPASQDSSSTAILQPEETVLDESGQNTSAAYREAASH